MSDAAPPALGGEREAPTRSPPGRSGADARMRALASFGDRKIELVEIAAPAAPAAGEVQIAVKAIGLNHIDVWGWRGMAFAKRKLPLIVGVEAAGEIVAVGPFRACRNGGKQRGVQGRRPRRRLWRAHLRHLQSLPRRPRQSLRERRRHHGLPRRRLRP